MFQHALKVASRFTYPYVGLRRRRSGEVFSTMGAFVVLDEAGWALTSAHLVEDILAVEKEAGQAESDPRPDVCVRHAEIWALPGFVERHPRIVEHVAHPLGDLAVVRLEPFDSADVTAYPVLRDTRSEPIEQGLSICRLGYPFHDIAVAWDDARSEFELGPDAFPVPSFALDGIVSRFHRLSSEDGQDTATFIETSTPGLRGQSGGPLLDVEGRVCGVQSHTTHLDLGFDARFYAGTSMVVERQFLNAGAATHVDDVVALLEASGVGFRRG